MNIVVMTIPGSDKTAFANELHEATGGGVNLVIVQKRQRRSLPARFRQLYRRSGWRGLPRELWYGFLLRMNGEVRGALEYFRGAASGGAEDRFEPKTIEVHSVNSDNVYASLRRLSPSILVVWGCAIIEPRILKLAEHAVNLHLGYCPHYRGALANHHAVLQGDHSKIGATIHYINGKPDAGDILGVISADTSKPPQELFRDLNVRARQKYLEIVKNIYDGESPPREKQDLSVGHTLLLKDWTPSLRYKLGRKVLEWEKRSH